MVDKKKKKDQESSHNLQVEQQRSPSDSALSPTEMQNTSNTSQKARTKPTKNRLLEGSVVLSLPLLYVVYTFFPQNGIINYQNKNFDFFKYCPLAEHNRFDLLGSLKKSNVTIQENRRMLTTMEKQGYLQKILTTTNLNDSIPTYVVYVRVIDKIGEIGKETNITSQLAYCSAVVENISTPCGLLPDKSTNEKYYCSSPGPLFYVEQNQPINVIWINDVNEQQSLSLKDNSSYHNDNKGEYYRNENKDRQRNCTYFDPTYQNCGSDSKMTQFNNKGVPLTTHVHGLEVRPTFDGHPMSWFLRSSSKGVGFMSLHQNKQYYKSSLFPNQPFQYFNDPNITTGLEYNPLVNSGSDANIKINNYPNKQSAGNLWYHDHSMRATAYNVANGLTGMYIIYNKEIQSYLSGKLNIEERMILIGRDSPFVTEPNKVYNKKIYRFRLLNGNFGQAANFTFQYFDGNKNVPMPTTVIGTDSVLFDKFVHNVSEFRMGPAERVQLLIDLQIIPQGVENFQLNVSGSAKPMTFALNKNEDKPTNRTELPTQMLCYVELESTNYKKQKTYNISLNPKGCVTKFHDLSPNQTKVDKMRFRVLDRVGSKLFSINGHTDFMRAASDNPQIGTTEDWFFINLFSGTPHPLHIHLIQYQIMAKYSLKMFNSKCSFYELDYYKITFPEDWKKSNNNHSTFCDKIQDFNGTKGLKTSTSDEIFDKVHLENKFTNQIKTKKDLAYNSSNSKQTIPVSGVYAYKLIENEEKKYYEPDTTANQSCSYSQYRYLCEDIPTPEWQKRWKQVALIEAGTIVRLRIRWASPDFDANATINQPSPTNIPKYFRLSEESIVEYPGYVYHCHILFHEDNQMMRPIMMQFSEAYKNYKPNATSKPNPQSWADLLSKSGFSCLNAHKGDNPKECVAKH